MRLMPAIIAVREDHVGLSDGDWSRFKSVTTPVCNMNAAQPEQATPSLR